MHIKASSDIFIHYLWGTDKNKDLLISFINTVLEDSEFQPIKDVQIKNPFNRKTFSFDKETVLDIKAIDEQGRQYNIEVQSTGDISFISRRLY
jgi:predicted transposase/invertase (TIGR01784 family)